MKRPITPVGDAENWYTEVTLSTLSWSVTHLILNLARPRFGDLERWSGLWGRDDEIRVSAIVRTNNTNGQSSHDPARGRTIHYDFMGLICTPIYNMSKATVSYRGDPGFAGAATQITLSSNTTAWQLHGLTSSAIVEAIYAHDSESSNGFIRGSLNNTGFDTDWLNNTGVLETILRTTHGIAAVQMVREQLSKFLRLTSLRAPSSVRNSDCSCILCHTHCSKACLCSS
jgi:phage tail protein X